jgi:hypothetical protein
MRTVLLGPATPQVPLRRIPLQRRDAAAVMSVSNAGKHGPWRKATARPEVRIEARLQPRLVSTDHRLAGGQIEGVGTLLATEFKQVSIASQFMMETAPHLCRGQRLRAVRPATSAADRRAPLRTPTTLAHRRPLSVQHPPFDRSSLLRRSFVGGPYRPRPCRRIETSSAFVRSRRNPATRSRHIPATWRGAQGRLEAPC